MGDPVTTMTRPAVLNKYRDLLRAINVVFKGDMVARTGARATARDEIYKFRDLTDKNEIVKLVDGMEDARTFILANVPARTSPESPHTCLLSLSLPPPLLYSVHRLVRHLMAQPLAHTSDAMQSLGFFRLTTMIH